MVLFFVYIVFSVDPASGLPNTINACVLLLSQTSLNRNIASALSEDFMAF